MMKLRPKYSDLNGFTMGAADGHVTRLLKALILQWACNLGHDECRAESMRLFKEWTQRSSPDYDNPLVYIIIYCSLAQTLVYHVSHNHVVDSI